MKVGVLSDTHDHLEATEQAVEIFKHQKVEMIIHCGDWIAPFSLVHFLESLDHFYVPVKGVFGNNDGDILMLREKNKTFQNLIEFPTGEILEVDIDDKIVAVYHGTDSLALNALIHSGRYSAVFCGHTHHCQNEVIQNCLVLNPGAVCFIVDGKVTPEASVAIYDSNTNSAEIITFHKH